MSYLPALFGTVAAYVLLAVLLLSLNIVSRWRFWVKAGAILVTTLAFFGTYFAITGLLGWPSAQSLPARFSLLSTRIIEPDKATGAPGRLFMWVEEIDEDNQPSADPRNHEVAYTTELAEKLYGAQQLLNQGQEVLGEMLEEPKGEEGEGDASSGESGSSIAPPSDNSASGGVLGTGAAGDGYLLDITESLQLSDMPPPPMPDKSPL